MPRLRRQHQSVDLRAIDIYASPDGLCMDVLTHHAESDTYRIHLGNGLPAAARARGALEVNVPAELLERLCWHLALALEHADTRRAAEASA